MKKLPCITYYIKTFLFIIHFYFVFLTLHNILDTKIYGYIFLLIYFIYIVKNIIELLTKKKRYKNDWIYNLMQISLIIYLIFFSLKTILDKIYVTKITYAYFRNNYIILSVLIVFILIYNIAWFNSKNKNMKN